MSIDIKPLTPVFGAEVFGANLHSPPDEAFVDTFNSLMAQYAVVVLRDQFISDDEQIRFSRAFGPLELVPHMGLKARPGRQLSRQLYDVSNLDDRGEILPTASLRNVASKANERFHTDSSFNALPTKWSFLSARILPAEGADTEFADTRAAYDELPHDMRARADGAIAEHFFWKTRIQAGFGEISDDMRRAMPPVQHAVVRTIPESGRKALYVGNHATHIVGWPVEEGSAFLDELNDFATQERFRYRHKWRDGDLVVWDNRCTVHRATAYDVERYKRDLRRTTINEYGPEVSSTDALGIPAPT